MIVEFYLSPARSHEEKTTVYNLVKMESGSNGYCQGHVGTIKLVKGFWNVYLGSGECMLATFESLAQAKSYAITVVRLLGIL